MTGIARGFALFAALAALVSCRDRDAAELANLPMHRANPLGQGIGVQLQPWYLGPGELGKIEAAGFGVVRWGIPWDRVEQVRGTYDWHEVDAFVHELAKTRLHSVVILGFGNRLYSPASARADPHVEAGAPLSPAARAAFAAFAAAAAGRYRDLPVTWEIWNEPDSATFWAPEPDPAAYARLAAETCRAIKSAVPASRVIGPGAAAMPDAVSGKSINLYSALVANGATRCLDGISAHAYRMSFSYNQPDPESVEANTRASMAYLYGTLKLPASKTFAVTEWGFTTARISANLQAAYLLRAMLINAVDGVPLTVWYEWRDSRPQGDDPEAHFGLLPTYAAEKSTLGATGLLAKIARANFVRRVETGRENVFAVLLRDKDGDMLVAWLRTDDERKRATLALNGANLAALSFMPIIVRLDGSGNLQLTVR